jgi:hypothetical protein
MDRASPPQEFRPDMNLVSSELNERLANAVRYSVAADRFYIKGKSGFWRLVGVGLVGLGLGGSIGIGCYGYSYVSRNSDNITSLATTISKALSEVHLKGAAAGTVQIEPHELTLAQGQMVSLDLESRLLLDPSAKVLADGEIRIQGPSISTPQSSPSRTPSIPTIANFTVFKSVPFEKGTVQTGWIFLTSAQRSPTQQYCYYTEASETPGRNIMLDIGTDEKLEVPKTAPNSFDVTGAFNRCVWFRGDDP